MKLKTSYLSNFFMTNDKNRLTRSQTKTVKQNLQISKEIG